MIASVVVRVLAFAAFAGLGIAWMSAPGTALAILWVAAFAVTVIASLWYATSEELRAGLWRRASAGLSRLGAWIARPRDTVPGPSKRAADHH